MKFYNVRVETEDWQAYQKAVSKQLIDRSTMAETMRKIFHEIVTGVLSNNYDIKKITSSVIINQTLKESSIAQNPPQSLIDSKSTKPSESGEPKKETTPWDSAANGDEPDDEALANL
jgi:hypothetical protein